jgi:hypothetical protein
VDVLDLDIVDIRTDAAVFYLSFISLSTCSSLSFCGSGNVLCMKFHKSLFCVSMSFTVKYPLKKVTPKLRNLESCLLKQVQKRVSTSRYDDSLYPIPVHLSDVFLTSLCPEDKYQ